MKKYLFATMVTGMLVAGCVENTPRLGKDSIDKVIEAMTLEEKVHLLIGNGMNKNVEGEGGAVVGSTEDLVPGAAGTTFAIPRLGIPSIVLADGPAGLRINPTRENDEKTYYATHFPIGTLLASTWDTALVEEVGEAIGNEVLEYGVDILLAPAMNIQRHPLNGRSFEYYSEDPVVSGKIASAYVNGVQKNGVGTSVKHFVANNQETNRTGNDAIISQRALREIYLKGFEIAVKESDPWTLMTSYNLLNGIYTAENPELLQTVLRNEWKYDGMIMTDWFGGKNAPTIVYAGNDMMQPGFPKQYEEILEAVERGELKIEDIDRNVKRILELIVRTPRFKGYEYSNNPDLKRHAEITRKSASEGMILLKNDNNTLPLDNKIKNVALFGNTSYNFIPGGTGSGNVNGAYTVSLLQGLNNAGYVVDEELKNFYEQHIITEKLRLETKGEEFWADWLPPTLPDEPAFSYSQLNAFADKNSTAIITIGRNSGEFVDRTSKDFNMSVGEMKLLNDVSKAFHAKGKPVIVILNVGGAIETASWKQKPDAILLAWQGGQEGGNTVADILTGKVNPSGKLAMTFPLKVTDPYSSINFPIDKEIDLNSFFDRDKKRGNEKDVDFTHYDEDVYVGYRYFETFNIPVSYPFGYGLSYTSFQYDEPTVTLKEDKYVVNINITNSGDKAGKEVVQLYISNPESKILNEPIIELKAFAKTSLLSPGQSETVKLEVPVASLAHFEEESSSWIINAGDYDFLVGASSKDIKRSIKVSVKESKRKVADILKPEIKLDILKRNQ